MVELLAVIFIHLITDNIAKHGADSHTDQSGFGVMADRLADEGPGCSSSNSHRSAPCSCLAQDVSSNMKRTARMLDVS